jgi:catechol 2,3-dioxygenase-like lactoylglutathione lyase family enzyme
MAHVRYFVTDVDRAVNFYHNAFGFGEKERYGSALAIVHRAGLELWLSGPNTSAAAAMPDGSMPRPGGWNRIVITVEDIQATVAKLRDLGTSFRNDVIAGPGGSQVLIEDPDGNPIEVFQSRE